MVRSHYLSDTVSGHPKTSVHCQLSDHTYYRWGSKPNPSTTSLGFALLYKNTYSVPYKLRLVEFHILIILKHIKFIYPHFTVSISCKVWQKNDSSPKNL